MTKQKVVDYLKQNKDKFEQDALISKLKSFGYPQVIIREAIEEVYGRKVSSVTNTTSLFDFRNKKVYLTSAEESLDLIFGLFGTWIFVWMMLWLLECIGNPFLGIYFDGLFLIPIVLILMMVWMFNRRRYIFKGMLLAFFLSPIVMVLFFVVMSN